MHITILAIGTRGDVQPYVALGFELKKLGHEVRIATFDLFRDLAEKFGLEFFPVRGDIAGAATGEQGRSSRQADNPLKLLLSFNQLQSHVFDLQQDLFAACQDSDSIIYHPGAAIGYFLARRLRIPAILATPFPMTPTREYPALMFYDSPRLGRSFNYLTHKVFEQVMWMASSAPIRQFWKKEFGGSPPGFGCPFSRQNTAQTPTIISCSKHVFPAPSDWSPHVHTTGYWFMDEEPGWQPPAELASFLGSGAPPVYVGFGSIGDPSQASQTTHLVVNALERCGQRGILATGWSGMTRVTDLPSSVFMLDSAPHAWLFPRMAAVVHHGGAATLAAGLRAGVPAVVIPHGLDQFAWARRVFELGVAARPLPRRQLTADRLADAIRFALGHEIHQAAEHLGASIRAESGAATAAGIVHATLTSS